MSLLPSCKPQLGKYTHANTHTHTYTHLFADDTKLMRRVNSIEDCRKLQEDLDKIVKWGRKWQMEFNTSKCRVVEFGKSKRRVHWDYMMEGVK